MGKHGAVLWLEWGSFQALLPLGLEFATLESLQNDMGQISWDMLLLTENGYAPINPPEWIAGFGPQVVLLSVGAGERSGRPDPELLQALGGYALLRTDRNGWIEVSTEVEKK